ncbi:MAG: glycerol-3-phosphate 1-O-acyltransferase PlsY [Oscillospiraceae bacterium]|nr:glycerol-3-phosphate 1-O-acyltransferase PlsY [Oscillospiraceae bacterium]
MMNVLLLALAVAVISYFLGCINSALILSKYLLHDDVRNHGSGNAGLTNFYRTFGKKMVLWVIVGDLLKAILSCNVGGLLLQGVLTPYLPSPAAALAMGKLLGGIFCMLGHSFPCMFGFKGGKGVLCGAGVIMTMDWRITLICLGVFALLVACTRWVSLGSMVAAVLFPINCWIIYDSLAVTLLAVVAGFLIVFRHKENAKRIAKGEENRFEIKKE